MKLLAMLLLLAGCTKAMPPAPATDTQPAPAAAATSGSRVILPDGFVVGVETVSDDEQSAQGLMYRDQRSIHPAPPHPPSRARAG